MCFQDASQQRHAKALIWLYLRHDIRSWKQVFLSACWQPHFCYNINQGSANCEMWNMRAKKLMHELNFSSWQEMILGFTCKSSWSLSFVLLLGDLTTTDFSCFSLPAKSHGSADSWSFGKKLSIYRNGKALCLVHIQASHVDNKCFQLAQKAFA